MISDDVPSLFDSASGIHTLSDTSSARGSIISYVSTRTAKLLGRKRHGGDGGGGSNTNSNADSNTSSARQSISRTNDSSSTISQCDVAAAGDDASSSAGATKQKGTFECGFCKEEGLSKTCTRKNDLKRHIEDFHNTNAQWHCRQRGCGMVFDWQTVYKTHLKHAHGGSRMALDDAKVTLCPQTVFACGFDNCAQVLEAPSDAEISGTFKEYVAHVIKHLDGAANSGEWTYSTRMRNLMRQSGVLRALANAPWSEADWNRLTWHTQSSNILRKRLETRHLGDLRLLVQYALALGSNPAAVAEFHESFKLPIADECEMPIRGHMNKMPLQVPPPQPPPAPQPQQRAQDHDRDQFSFKISRGTGRHPQLANYYASQRQILVARPPVRSGRSARPPARAVPTSSPMQPQQQQAFQRRPSAAPNMFDPTDYYQSQPQHQCPMLGAAEGGIIADDLRSLRSMASSTSSSNNMNGADVDMSDAQMMGGDNSAGYMSPPQQQDFSAPYGTGGGLPSPAEPDHGIKMEQPPHLGGFAQGGY